MLIFASIFCLLVAYPMLGTGASVWTLAASQLLLLINEIRKGQVTGGGAFLFMSFLFFGMRPIYLLIEKDYRLLVNLFLVGSDWGTITEAMWWGTLAAICFAIGIQIAPRVHRKLFIRRREQNKIQAAQVPVDRTVTFVMFAAQVVTLGLMAVLARAGRGLYDSGAGAYIYELPVPLQAVQIIAVVVFAERFFQRRDLGNLLLVALSVSLLLAFSWLMRDVSRFRGFYLTGIIITGIGILHYYKARVGYAWLVIPIIVTLPVFEYLGAQRVASNEELMDKEIIADVFKDEGVLNAYWRFYAASGDMNIFDTFVAATKAEISQRPYILSWLYVPVHLVPRALWPGKPKGGIVQDVSFARGAPLSPGIAGFFLLDGGKLWMLGCMMALGYLISCLDYFVLTTKRGWVRSILIGVLVANGMFLTRVFLWQYFYGVFYVVVPLLLFGWLFKRRRSTLRFRHGQGLAPGRLRPPPIVGSESG